MVFLSQESDEKGGKAPSRIPLIVVSVILGLATSAGVIFFSGVTAVVAELGRGIAITPNAIIMVSVTGFIALSAGVSVAQISYDTLVQHKEGTR